MAQATIDYPVQFSVDYPDRYPRGLFGFIVGVQRWSNRVGAYAIILSTDNYPPFRLGA